MVLPAWPRNCSCSPVQLLHTLDADLQGCPEDVLTPATIQAGYKEAAADVGVPEASEHESAAVLFLQATAFSGGMALAPSAATAAAAAAAAAGSARPPLTPEDASRSVEQLRQGVMNLIQRTLRKKASQQQGGSSADAAPPLPGPSSSGSTPAARLVAAVASAVGDAELPRKLPDLHPVSDEERVAWLHELAAGSHSLTYMAATMPTFPNRCGRWLQQG